MRARGLVATTLSDGATNGEPLRIHVTDILVPALKPGDTVVLDNPNVRKVAGVREAVAAAGARIFHLPAHSPDFDPIDPSTGSG